MTDTGGGIEQQQFIQKNNNMATTTTTTASSLSSAQQQTTSSGVSNHSQSSTTTTAGASAREQRAPMLDRDREQHHHGGGGGGQSGGPHGAMREYCLRWNNHQPNLVNFFGTLLQRESFVDVTLVSSEGKQLHAHKLVLSACSPYFQHVFESNPCKHPVVILKDIHYSDLRTIISFVYNGEVNISQDKINSILATASTLQIKGLAEVPADELKRVGGPRGANDSNVTNRSHPPPLQSSSPWASADGEEFVHTEIPRKKLKKSTSAAGPSGMSSQSTNGENTSSAGGSFESGVGASMSRSLDDGTSLGVLESSVRSPASRPGPPPLTAGSQLAHQQKSRSLDIGIEREAAHIDSELSSGGFSENQTYDDSSLGADRGFELEIADVKIEAVSDDGEIEFDEEFDQHPDHPDFELNQSFPNYPSSSSSLFHQSSRHLGSSVGGGKGRRGRLLIRQPRIKRLDNEPGRGNGSEVNLTAEDLSGGSEESMTIITSGPQSQPGREDISRGGESPSFSHTLFRQQSIVPIVTVSESSPTPPSSPSPQPQSVVKDVTAIRHTSFSSGSSAGSGSRLLMIPGGSDEGFRGHSSTATLVKQLSQPHLPSQTSSSTASSVGLPRQHSQPTPGSMQTTSCLVYSGVKPGDLFQIVPTEGFRGKMEDTEGSFLVDSSSILQIIPAGEANSGNSSGRVTFTSKGAVKEIEIFRRDLKRELSEGGGEPSMGSEDSAQGEGLFIDEGDTSQVPPMQRSGHCPALRPGPALGCNFCWNSVDKCGRILRRKTKYHCPECRINLCIVPCFQHYHEKEDKKKVKGSKLLLPKPSSM